MLRLPRRRIHMSVVISIGILLHILISTNRIYAQASQSTTATTITNNVISLPAVSNSEEEKWGWQRCVSHETCDECYKASSTCHWCANKNKCQPKGSPLGCVVGASCSNTPPPQTCSDHKSCSDCANSSWGCHWCQSKDGDSCHAQGSIHGCSLGADCYAINRCQRLEPERMEDAGIFSSQSFQGVGPVAKGVLGVLMGLILCCSTLCFGGITFLKCAVDDLVGEPVEIVEDGEVVIRSTDDGQIYERILDTAEAEEGEEDDEEEGQRDDLEMPLMQNEATEDDEKEDTTKVAGEDVNVEEEEDGISSLPKKRQSSVLRRPDAASISRMSRRSVRSSRVTPRGSSIKQMYCGCQICYLFTVISTIILFVVGMSYAPRQPQINVCTNEMAWKSIVEGMASLKISASFDLLISVYNPNKFEVDLSDGHGQFHHDDQYVGSFDIPEGKISENAISDIIVKVTFTPDKWAALSLTSEYYRGKLKFVVGGHIHIKVPGLANYQFESKFDDIHINVNDPKMDHTELCACPGWKRPVSVPSFLL